MAKKRVKEDPAKEILKELKKYYRGTPRVKAKTNFGDECCQK